MTLSAGARRAVARRLAWLAPFLLLALAACMPGNENSVIDRPLANDARMPGLWVGRLGDDDARGRCGSRPKRRKSCWSMSASTPRTPRSPATAPRGRRSAGGTSWSSPRPTPPAGPGSARRWTWASVSSSPTRSTATATCRSIFRTICTTPLEKAVDQGALAGHSEARAGNTRTLVTAPTAALRDFVAKTPDVFGTPPIVFTKMPLPAK